MQESMRVEGCGKRCLLLTHIGRRSGVRRETVLEVVEYRQEGPDSDWLRNIEVKPGFVASHRVLGEEEATRVIAGYEHRNRFITPIVRAGFSWLLGWQYRGGESDRQRLVRQLPLIAFRPERARR